MAKHAQSLIDRLDQKVFDAIYSRSLVYNTCWEDPAVDRLALALRPHDRMLVIASAGCNVLDYALVAPAVIHAVDANPRQTALLELKLAGIRQLEFEDFFAVFGDGHHPRFGSLYRELLRAHLSPFARDYWDRHGHWFCEIDPGDSFYYHGLSGTVARGFRAYLRLRPALRSAIETLLESSSLEHQCRIYDRDVRPQLWGNGLNWVLSRQLTMSMLGVPHPQKKEVERQHERGVAGFVREAVDYVFRSLPVRTNYFWTLYLRGRYSADCCPEYLRPENFSALKRGLADRIEVHTCTVTEFLQGTRERISRFVLLDHMDWMSSYYPEALAEEWDAICERATADARVIFRSARREPDYLDALRLVDGRAVRDRLQFHEELSAALQVRDRVHTYAGFHIADIRA
ncbi:MAG: BtaA family protein [Proteobacteria bacterium]|nr:BtaA family protein [Pseudomonadota bacterium]